MHKVISFIWCLSFLPLCATFSSGCLPASLKTENSQIERKQLTQNREIAEQVKEAFDAVKKNKTSATLPEEQILLDNLKKLGEQVVPYLEPYLNDVNIAVRMEVVKLAFEIGGENSLNLLAKALHNSNLQIKKNVSDRLFDCYSQSKKLNKDSSVFGKNSRCENFSAETIAANPQIGGGIKEIIKSGNTFVSAIFLLASFPDDETKEILRKVSHEENLKSGKKSLIISESQIAAAIVLASAGEDEAARFLLKIIEKNNTQTLKFLLKNISEIETTEVLSAMLKTFDIKTVIEGKPTPTELAKLRTSRGIYVDLKPPRRLCDLAVNSFVERFNLNVSFQLHTTTYIEKQVSEARDMSQKIVSAK